MIIQEANDDPESSAPSENEQITDLETIREMFTKFIEENTLNARCVSSDLYPDYAKTVVIEWNAGTTDGKALLDFAAQSNIARAYFNLVALNENGEPMIIQDADITDPNDNAELPQTGYSDIYKAIEGLATLMTVGGAALVVKTRKENE